jgi:uncharacterized coiled-coil DUF342 family protein
MNIFTEHWEIMIGGVASILAYIGGKGKREYQSLTEMQDAYNKFVVNWREKYDEVEKDLHHMQKQLADLDHQVHTLHKENQELKEELNKWKDKYEALKKEFDAAKKTRTAMPRMPKNGKQDDV